MATKQDDNKQWYMATALETSAAFEVQVKKGLTSEQVRERTVKPKRSVRSKLPKTPRLSIFFWATLFIMVVLAVSVFMLEPNNAVFIFAFSACMLAAFGLSQQNFVRHIVLTIAKSQEPKVAVRRDGLVAKVSSSSIVPGDILVFEQGDFIPVEVRLLELKNLVADESTATGQSTPEQKNTFALHKRTKPINQKNMIAAGSYITAGSGVGIAVTRSSIVNKYAEINVQKLNSKQQSRNLVVSFGAFGLGLTTAFWGVPTTAVVGLGVLLALSTYHYANFWLQYVTWASLYDQANINGIRFKDFKKLKVFCKVDTVFVNVPSDFTDIAALVHQLQAELRIEVRPLVKAGDVKKLEKELNIQDSALKYKDFMSANRARKIQQISEYQLLVGFDNVAIAEAVSLVQQTGHHVAWIDDSVIPQPVSTIASTYISLNAEPSALIQSKSDVVFSRKINLKKVATFLDVKTRFKKITAY